MQEKIKVLTIGDCQNSTLENYFKDNKNIEFLELALNENTEKLNNKLSNRNVVFLRSKEACMAISVECLQMESRNTTGQCSCTTSSLSITFVTK